MAAAAPKHKDVPALLAAPNYALDGQDRVTFNVQNREGLVKLVLHMGTGRPEDKTAPPIMSDADGLAKWQSDIRAVITFSGADDVAAKRDGVLDFVRRWLAIPA